MTHERAAVEELDDAIRFKRAFRRYPTGVAVVTASPVGGPVGLTASSVASVAAEPAVLSFSVATSGRSAGRLLEARDLTVHLLSASQAHVADAFARAGAPRFTADQGWELHRGSWRLPDALAELDCRVESLVPVGGSTIVVVGVVATRLGPASAPLVHHDRTFRRLGPVVETRTSGVAGAGA